MTIRGWTVTEGVTHSDHNLITLDVSNGRAATTEVPCLPSRFRISRDGCLRFRMSVKAQIGALATATDSEEMVKQNAEQLTKILKKACENSFNTIKVRRKVAPWWNRQLQELKERSYRARRELQRATCPGRKPELLRTYKQARQAFTKAVATEKKKSWQRFVEEEANKDIWRTVRRIRGNNDNSGRLISTSKSRDTKTWAEAADSLLDHFVKRDPLSEDTVEHATIRAASETVPSSPTADRVTEEEVQRLISKLKNKVTPGLDLIENEMLKTAGDLLAPGLARLFNGCLRHGVSPRSWKEARLIAIPKKKDSNLDDPKAYRPICLLTGVSKLLEKVLKSRIQETYSLHSRQYGFREGSNTTDAISALINICKTTKHQHVVIILIDIEAAFDSLWWPHVLTELKNHNCPEDVFRATTSYLRDRELLLIDGPSQARRRQERGCPQGSVLGPTLWNIAINSLLEALSGKEGVEPVAYADDLAIIVGGKTIASMESSAQNAIETVSRWCEKAKLKIAKGKTTCLIARGISKGTIQIRDNEGDLLNVESTAKYLGVWIDSRLKFRTHCQKAGEKAKSNMAKFRAVARARWGLGGKNLLSIYRAIFVPTVTYAAGAWALRATKRDVSSLATAQRSALLVATRAYRTISGPALLVIAGVQHIQREMEAETLRHCVRSGIPVEIGGRTYDPGVKDPAALKEQLKKDQSEVEQLEWQEDYRGRITYEYFPSVQGRRESPWVIPSYYLTQYLSGHGNFKSKLRKFNLVRSDRCKCGLEDTVHHTFRECPELQECRDKYRAELAGAGITWPITAEESVTEKAADITALYVKRVLQQKEAWDSAMV